MRVRLVLASTCLLAGAMLALSTPARADDCATRVRTIQDLNDPYAVQDCLRTGQSFSVAIGSVVAGVGVVIALAGLPGGGSPPPARPATPQPPESRRETEPTQQTQQHADPCFDQQSRFTSAQTAARTQFTALQTLRNQRAYLDSLWNSTRETGYYTGLIDLGMLMTSVFSKPAVAAGEAIVKKTLAVKVGETMLKSLGKELAKDVIKYTEDQGINWSDLAAKPIGITQTPQGPTMTVPQGATGKLYTEAIKKALTQIEYNRVAKELAGTGRTPDLKVIESTYSGPIADAVGNTFSAVSMTTSAWGAKEKLEAIQKSISDLDDSILRVEEQFDASSFELELARSSLNQCRALHGGAGP